MTTRKQISMVLPIPLINAIKQRAQQRGQSITAYISGLAQADLQQALDVDPDLTERLEHMEERLKRLERQLDDTASRTP
jgi:hypothetical protein